MKEIKIIIVDDKKNIREGLKLMLARTKEIKIMAEASDGKEAIDLITQNEYDVVLMDIKMPNMDGIEATKKIKKTHPHIKILTNSYQVSSFHINEMLRAGASGFIRKGDDIDSYIEAIWTVDNGGIYLSDEINNKTYDKLLDLLKPPKLICLN